MYTFYTRYEAAAPTSKEAPESKWKDTRFKPTESQQFSLLVLPPMSVSQKQSKTMSVHLSSLECADVAASLCRPTAPQSDLFGSFGDFVPSISKGGSDTAKPASPDSRSMGCKRHLPRLHYSSAMVSVVSICTGKIMLLQILKCRHRQ